MGKGPKVSMLKCTHSLRRCMVAFPSTRCYVLPKLPFLKPVELLRAPWPSKLERLPSWTEALAKVIKLLQGEW